MNEIFKPQELSTHEYNLSERLSVISNSSLRIS